MFAPSKATPTGLGPLGNSVGTVLALYHFSSATFSGFDSGGAPFPAGCADSPAACCAWLTNKFAIAIAARTRPVTITTRIFINSYSSNFPRVGRSAFYEKYGPARPQ